MHCKDRCVCLNIVWFMLIKISFIKKVSLETSRINKNCILSEHQNCSSSPTNQWRPPDLLLATKIIMCWNSVISCDILWLNSLLKSALFYIVFLQSIPQHIWRGDTKVIQHFIANVFSSAIKEKEHKTTNTNLQLNKFVKAVYLHNLNETFIATTRK